MKRNGFTLIELLVVVAIIGILAAVGTVAYNGYTLAAKVSVTKAQYKTLVKHQIAEITKCQLGMIEKIGHLDYNAKPCPLRWGGAAEWRTSMGSQCSNPGGAFMEWRNPYNTGNCNYNFGDSHEKDKSVGRILYKDISDTEISIAVCWKTPCSSPENRGETIFDISEI